MVLTGWPIRSAEDFGEIEILLKNPFWSLKFLVVLGLIQQIASRKKF